MKFMEIWSFFKKIEMTNDKFLDYLIYVKD